MTRAIERSPASHWRCVEARFVGIAGVSGNGQRELTEVLAGQREPSGGDSRGSWNALSRVAVGDAPPQDLLPAGGAAAQCLRGAYDDFGESGLPFGSTCRRSPSAGFLISRAAIRAAANQIDRPVQYQDAVARCSCQNTLRWQRATHGLG